MQVESRVTLEIDLKKLADNFRKVQQAVSPCNVISVLKANAYGLGVKPIAQALALAGTSRFGVAELNEAIELTDLGLPIHILGSVLKNEIPVALENNIILPISDYDTAVEINNQAEVREMQAECHILVDTGMGRLGLQSQHAFELIKKIVAMPHLRCTGIYSHFPVAYSDGSDYTLAQVNRFKELLTSLKNDGIEFDIVHIANSDAINNFPETYCEPFNYVRTGINLHGSFDPEGKRSLEIESILELKTKLMSVRELPAGACIGYGLTCKLSKPTRVGTISAGYADGLPLALSNRGHVIINGQPCPILGRISMDYTTVSLDNAPDAKAGDDVICLGGEGVHKISVEDWATAKGTHAYEIICSFGNRVQHNYLH